MKRTRWSLAAAMALVLPGCAVGYMSFQHEIDERARAPVRFASPLAARAFHSVLAQRLAAPKHGGTSTVYVPIPFVLVVVLATVHETEFYNAQVKRADQDSDGTISEQEAQSYAQE